MLNVVWSLAALPVARSVGAQAVPPSRTFDSAAVAAFADAFFPGEMAKRHIPGLTFAFVTANGVTLLRGYGYAQLEPRAPVGPENTAFLLAFVGHIHGGFPDFGYGIPPIAGLL